MVANIAAVSNQSEDATAVALLSEQRLYPAARLLSETTTVAKALLVRPTAINIAARVRISLTPVVTERDWTVYADHRVAVEAGLGLDEATARAMVSTVRARTSHRGLDLYLARDAGTVVGAIARFRLPAPHAHWARLQEVDVFPVRRNRGYGNAVLAAMLTLLATEDSTMVVVGADEDDWPLSWYRRHGFDDVGRVPLTR